jgi:hypothetical protein
MEENKLEMLEMVVKEQAEEQAKTNQLINDLITKVNLLRNEVSGFNEKLDNQNITVKTDTQPIEEIITGGILKISLMIERVLDKQRSNIWQIFFQSDAKKWAVILAVAITFLTYLYWFSLDCLKK